MTVCFVDIDWAGRTVRIEHAWVAPGCGGSTTADAEVHGGDQAAADLRPDGGAATAAAEFGNGDAADRRPHDANAAGSRPAGTTPAHAGSAPLLVFLHEGLGSLSAWKAFPQALCTAAGCRGLVYSRPGYGRSTPRAAGDAWGTDFLHRQALQVLPALLAALGLGGERVCLFGHSDGGSIALLHAAHRPANVAGAIVLAPHTFVEDVSVASIAAARDAFLHGSLRQRLARHHADPDSAFWGWNRIWLDPAFRGWRIDDEIAAVRCPLLAVQGTGDEYGTLQQIRGIAARVPGTQLLALPDCGHAPQRDQPQAVIDAACAFIGALGRR